MSDKKCITCKVGKRFNQFGYLGVWEQCIKCSMRMEKTQGRDAVRAKFPRNSQNHRLQNVETVVDSGCRERKTRSPSEMKDSKMPKNWSTFQNDIFAWPNSTNKTHLVVEAGAGTGKCLGKDTPVMLFDGTVVPVQSIARGALLMGPDSKPRRVLSVSRGVGPLYRITPIKGDSWVCNDVHILTLSGTNKKMGQVRDVSLKDLIAETHTGRIDRNWKLFRVPVVFQPQDTPVDPYLVGLWLGDGTRGESQITNSSPEVIDYCKKAASAHGLECVLREDRENNTWNIRFRVGERGDTGPHTPNTLRRFFQSCEVDGFKEMPATYLKNSRDVRLSLLAGLLDTDGHLTCNGYEWVSVSHKMAEQFLFLCRSLGFAAYASDKTVNGTVYKRVSVSGDLSIVPLKRGYKQAMDRKQIKRVTHTGFCADPIGTGEFFGFMLDGDGRFLLGDFTVTHNTTTIVELYRRIVDAEPYAKVQFLAFNKKIAEELSERGVPANTMNSFGFRAITKASSVRISMDTNKIRNICKKLNIEWTKIAMINKIVDLMKAYLVPASPSHADVATIVREFALEDEKNTFTVEYMDQIINVFRTSLQERKVIDFSDQICFPHYHEMRVEKFDYVIVDECQDLSPNKLALVTKAVGKHFVGVGDPLQAIYGFCGADSLSMEKIKAHFKPLVLSLPVTYRCGKQIVAEAHRMGVAPANYQAGPDNHEGKITNSTHADFLQTVQPKDFVLCRVTAPLVKNCFQLIKKGIRAHILGRDVGAKLVKLVEKIEKQQSGDGITGFVTAATEYRAREVGKLMAAQKDSQADALSDQMECLNVFIEGAQDMLEVRQKIANMFDDTINPHAVLFSTIHKAKGLEADRVWALAYNGRKTKTAKEAQEEQNLVYVCLTRAKFEFTWVAPEPKTN